MTSVPRIASSPDSHEPQIVLEVRGVSHWYQPDTPVLRDVDLSVREGETVALMGPSGSGKSTLVNILGLLLDPVEGQVTVPERGHAADSRLRRDYFGWVFQSINSLPRRSVLDNVMLPLLARGVSQPLAEAAARTRLEEVGLAGRESQSAFHLSGGELQRMGIARARAADPPVVLADEPTGQLDRATSQSVIDVLVRRLQPPTALVVVTHDDAVMSACTRRYDMDAGRLVARYKK